MGQFVQGHQDYEKKITTTYLSVHAIYILLTITKAMLKHFNLVINSINSSSYV